MAEGAHLLPSAIKSCGGKIGLGVPTDVLRGSMASGVVDNSFDKLPVHGLGRGKVQIGGSPGQTSFLVWFYMHCKFCGNSRVERKFCNLLLDVRADIGRRNSTAPYAILNEKTLQKIAKPRPLSEARLRNIDGVNQNLAERPKPMKEETVIDYVWECIKLGYEVEWERFCNEVGFARRAALDAVERAGATGLMKPIEEEAPEHITYSET